jgi:hypothetical protein
MSRVLACACVLALAATATAQTAVPPARDPGYAPLQNFVGKWTMKGKEQSFREDCDWYDGRFHIVCHSEFTRDDGSTGRGISIMGFVPGEGYVYTGIGNRGRYETLSGGTVSEDVLEYRSTTVEDGKPTIVRIRIGPFAEAGMPFVVDASTDDGKSWSNLETSEYVRR